MKLQIIQNENQLIWVPNELYETFRDKETEAQNSYNNELLNISF